jgi:acetylglutamate kinase
MDAPIVIKIGGNELDQPGYIAEFAAAVRGLNQQVVIVHGGGKEISNLQRTLNIIPEYVDGVRVTDQKSLEIVEMVLCGTVNKRLVWSLLKVGVDALGISGVDRGLVRAEQLSPEMGFVGKVKSVRGDVLLEMLRQGITPVVAPLSYGEGGTYNVNADHVAGAIAAAIQASQIIFLSNVSGVISQHEMVIPTLTPGSTEALIANGTIHSGMIPKVRTALEVLEQGAAQAVITNLEGLRTGGGTIFARA